MLTGLNDVQFLNSGHIVPVNQLWATYVHRPLQFQRQET